MGVPQGYLFSPEGAADVALAIVFAGASGAAGLLLLRRVRHRNLQSTEDSVQQ